MKRMDTVIVKCVQGKTFYFGVKEYITIDRVELLFVDSSLNNEKITIEYPNLNNNKSTTTSSKTESHDEPDCGRILPLFFNIENESINKRLENLLIGVENVVTFDKTSKAYLKYFTHFDIKFISIECK